MKFPVNAASNHRIFEHSTTLCALNVRSPDAPYRIVMSENSVLSVNLTRNS